MKDIARGYYLHKNIGGSYTLYCELLESRSDQLNLGPISIQHSAEERDRPFDLHGSNSAPCQDDIMKDEVDQNWTAIPPCEHELSLRTRASPATDLRKSAKAVPNWVSARNPRRPGVHDLPRSSVG